ncbi:hypothetical protein EV126DRAFT_223930 [Verticillium dahliae]|nr:hypothetical protein EV126DRAFT_223930 [Verticillium dahliae]
MLPKLNGRVALTRVTTGSREGLLLCSRYRKLARRRQQRRHISKPAKVPKEPFARQQQDQQAPVSIIGDNGSQRLAENGPLGPGKGPSNAQTRLETDLSQQPLVELAHTTHLGCFDDDTEPPVPPVSMSFSSGLDLRLGMAMQPPPFLHRTQATRAASTRDMLSSCFECKPLQPLGPLRPRRAMPFVPAPSASWELHATLI